jgi:hypothetical protein
LSTPPTIQERNGTMKANKDIVRINLTPSQREQVKQQTGKDAESIELKVSELEERIAPRIA